jgi:3',5'-cyclic AMP phosphodiesterase CpdA
MNLRRFALCGLLVLLLLAACQGSVRGGAQGGAKNPPGDAALPAALRIYVTNDVHYLAGGLHDQGARYQRVLAERDGKNMEMIEPILRSLRYTAERERPDILLLNGDLTYNGEAASHRGLASYLGALERLGTRVYVIPGNHDIDNPWARSFFNDHAYYTDVVSPQEFRAIYRNFGYGEALSQDPVGLSYVAEPAPKLRLLMLDSSQYARNRELGYPETGGALSPATRSWIRNVAEAARKDGVLLAAAMHHSLMDHHSMVNQGFTVAEAGSLRELLASLGINFILTGHIHAQDISVRETASGPIYDIATSALAVYPHQIGVLHLIPEEGRWQYTVQAPEVEAWARASGLEDARLLHFGSYSEGFFRRNAEDMVRRRLDPEAGADEAGDGGLKAGETGGGLSPGELTALSELMGTLNARYFAGTEYLNRDLLESEGFRLLESRRFDFLYDYARAIMEDRPPANTELSIPIPGYGGGLSYAGRPGRSGPG